jgi:hypothetical protein
VALFAAGRPGNSSLLQIVTAAPSATPKMCHSEEGQKEKKEMEAKWGKKKNNN